MKQIVIAYKDRNKLIDAVVEKLVELPEDKLLEVVIRDPKRTSRQNRAMHKFFEILAEQFNEMGLGYQDIFSVNIEVKWTPALVKEALWRHVQRVSTGKESSTKLTTKELSDIAEAIERGLAIKGIDIAFPSIDSLREGNN